MGLGLDGECFFFEGEHSLLDSCAHGFCFFSLSLGMHAEQLQFDTELEELLLELLEEEE